MASDPSDFRSRLAQRLRAIRLADAKQLWADHKRLWLALGGVALLLMLLIGTLPVGLAKGWAERKLSDRFGAPVTIGALSREPFFSFTPTVVVRDLAIGQPRWAGTGDFARVAQLRLRVPILPLLTGGGLNPSDIEARGLALALVRDAQGRSNWGGEGPGGGSDRDGTGLSDLTITDGRFTLRDTKRNLSLAGQLRADHARGLTVQGSGRFHDAPITASLSSPPIDKAAPRQPHPLRFALRSSLLDMNASGTTAGPLNMRDMALDISARGASLKYLDDIIQAGLFGTQPIRLEAKVRHKGQDWFVDRIAGTIGRSSLTGKAEIRKVEGRSKIDATLDFATFDFDDLADDKGIAAGKALEARIGPRVLPNVRINLAKVGPTDGQIHFTARKLLFEGPSVFRSLKGLVKLEGKLLTITQIEAGLTNGRMSGEMAVDHRQGTSPLLAIDLQFRDGSLGPLINAPDRIDAPFGARIRLKGRGDTIRAALEQGEGHVGFVAGEGRVAKIAATVLAQDMGKTLGAVIGGDSDETVGLTCIAAGFDAKKGVLRAAPFLIETEISRSRGEGTITLNGERIALVIGGTARDPSGLPLVDPLTLGGTLSAPALGISGTAREKASIGSVAGALFKSLGAALGIGEKKGPQVTAKGPIDCPALARHVLQADRAD